jgi:hypothetical protein
MSRPLKPDPGDDARKEAIHAADAALDRAVRSKRALLLDGSLTSDAYCSACWGIIAARKESARQIEMEHPIFPVVRVQVDVGSWAL